MEPFIPIPVTQALDALGNLALILVTPCIIYLTLMVVKLDSTAKEHAEKLKLLNEIVGIHYSKIHDLQLDVAVMNKRPEK
tara:strand:+ start:146 stop:385 length:240 start_codon:yes stop_codon:yes gene_type:complete